MRIISGNLKGRKINFIKNKTTRPLTDRVKENIFNILQHSNKIKDLLGYVSKSEVIHKDDMVEV